MNSNGYNLEDNIEKADGKITIYSSSDSKWITAFSDLFEIKNSEDFKNIYNLLKINNDFLGIYCYDSDYLALNYINKNIDAWVNIGSSDEISGMRKSNFKDWKSVINNMEKFKELVKTKYTFAEDFLDNSNEFFEIPKNQAMMQDGINIDNDFIEIYFSSSEQKNERELPKFEMQYCTTMPCIPGEPQVISMYNTGKESRGLQIVIFRDFVEKEEITFTQAHLQIYNKNEWKIIPIKFEKVNNGNGLWGYKWVDENFYIPPKPKENLSPMKKQKLIFERSIGIKFVPSGNIKKFLDIKVCFIPLKNPRDGQCSWYAWKNYQSKRNFVEEHNKNVILEQEYYKKYGIKNEIGKFPENRNGLIDLDYFDLD